MGAKNLQAKTREAVICVDYLKGLLKKCEALRGLWLYRTSPKSIATKLLFSQHLRVKLLVIIMATNPKLRHCITF